MKLKLSKFKKGDKVYLYEGMESSILVLILDVYLNENNEWTYEIDCSTFKKGMILEDVNEAYLGWNYKPNNLNKQLSVGLLMRFSEMMDN